MTSEPYPWPSGDGEVARQMRTRDWSATSLGPCSNWSQRLQVMVEQVLASPLVATLVCGPDHLLIYNDAAARLYGDHHPAALGHSLPLVFPSGWETVSSFYERAFAGEVVTIAGQPLDTRGEGAVTEVFDALLTPVREAGGQVAYVHMTGFDIVERQRSEAALRESREQLSLMLATAEEQLRQKAATDVALGIAEARWQLALEATDLAVYEWDLGSDHQIVNDRFRDLILGTRSDESVIGARIMQECVYPDDRAWIDPELARAMEGASNGKFSFEHRLNRLDLFGDAPWVFSHGQVVFDGQGSDRRPVRMFGTLQDISERKRAEHALRKSDERKAFLLELSDAVRPLARPADIQGETTRLVREALHAGWCYYVDWDLDKEVGLVLRDSVSEGLPSLAGAHDVSDALEFVQLLAVGEVLSVSDYANYEQLPARIRQNFTGLGFRSMMAAPLVKEGCLIATLLVGDTRTREWTASESSLLIEVAERTWAAIERGRAEAALRESETRLAAAFDSVPVGIAVLNMAGRVVFANALYQRFLPTGIMPSRDPQRVGRWRAWNSEGRPMAVEDFPGSRALRGESVVPGQEMLFTEDAGKEIWTSVAMVPTRDTDGQVTGMVSVVGDIDIEKRSVAALRESEERLRQFGEASQDILWIRDVESLQWQYLSPAFETIYGVSREAALAGDNYQNWQALIVPEDRAHAVDSIARVARGEQVVFEYRIRRPADGQVRWLRNTDFPMGGDDGTTLRIGGVGHDITALKTIEDALAAAEQRQRLLLEGMPQLVWRAVDEGQWNWASPQWIEYTGVSDEASGGFGWLETLHPDDREAARTAWTEAPTEGTYHVEYRIRHAQSGLYRWFQTRGTPIRRADGSVVEWLGTSTDIDEQVRAREFLVQASVELEHRVAERTVELQQALDTMHHEAREREQAEERLRQSEKLKAVGQLTGGIAHDFNNMLQGITSALALINARLDQGRVEAAKGYIEPAQKAAGRAGALTQRLLAFSRQQTLAPRSINLNQVTFDMQDMIRRAVGPAVQVELKSSDGHWRVLCDANQMESALLNLCINARDAMPEGGWLTIGIEDRILSATDLAGFEDLTPGRFVALSVTDTGSGMPPEVMARAFEPFFTTKPPGHGTGLGLSQIYGFMRQSGGLVQIETVPGAGTTVRLALPVYEAEDNHRHGVVTNGKTLLLVEDEHDLRRMLGDQLRDLGYGVLEADTAEAALRVLHTGHQVDLLVTDVGLRGTMNGRQLAEAARRHTAKLPVLFITGYASENLFGEDNVLRKPFKPALLALRIREQIG